MALRIVGALAIALVAACSSDRPPIRVFAEPEVYPRLTRFVELIPYTQLELAESADPIAEAEAGGGIRVAVVADQDCTECYRIEEAGGGFVVRGDAPLGVQYGLARFFEELGFRFFHPWKTYTPGEPRASISAAALGETFEPEIATRGLHLHTLHPIDPYYAFWESGEENLEEARRILDWIIKNRGNYVQWIALDDILGDAGRAGAWREHTGAILDEAHGRGLEVGVGIQLFGRSNLQQGFDLLDGEDGEPPPREEMEARYPVLLEGLDWDSISLSFGEFSSEDPQRFIDSVNLAYEVLQDHAPGIRMTGTVHVGDTEDTRVEYMGEDLIYYFLVEYAHPAIVPYVHTVMFYNLFESAGGAYHHQDFSEHRDYLLEKLAAGEPVAYHPETAYWIAFDVSVPAYFPLYVRSRWLDLAEIRAAGAAPLPEHTIFSTGWEWGYWQNDYASLRMSYRLPGSWEEIFEGMFAPLGEGGAALAGAAAELAALQADYLIGRELTAYIAGRDFYIDVGDDVDIVSQPDRPSFAEVAALDPGARERFEADVLDPLAELAEQTGELAARVRAIDLPGGDRFEREAREGFAVTAARTRYIHALYRAVFDDAGGGSAAPWLEEADAALAGGRELVRARHGDLHRPRAEQLLNSNSNATLYQWGYLKQADDLCYWERERVEVDNLLEGRDDSVPGCIY